MNYRATTNIDVGVQKGKSGDPARNVQPTKPKVDRIEAGDIVTEKRIGKDLEGLVARGFLVPADAAATAVVGPTDPAERAELVVAAIETIHKSGPEKAFTKSGAPRVDAVEACVGFSIDETERDDGWEAFQEKNPTLFTAK